MVIYTYYDKKPIMRGNYYKETNTFVRNNYPLISNRYIALEPDVCDELFRHGGNVNMKFRLRDKRTIITTLEEFRKTRMETMGLPGNERLQYILDTKPASINTRHKEVKLKENTLW